MNISKASTWLVLPATLLISVSTFADSDKHISHTVDAAELDSARLEFPIGQLEIVTYDDDEIQLDIEIEAERHWFIFSKKDVADVELEVQIVGSNVYLGIDNDDVEQHWIVKIPTKLALTIEVGVGEIKIEEFSNNLEMDLGVGSVRVEVAGADYDVIHVESGIGDAQIVGFSQSAESERNFISADAIYHGEGDLEMEIEVGVGDIQVKST